VLCSCVIAILFIVLLFILLWLFFSLLYIMAS